MAVPEEIRRVPRPKNTVVVDTGSKGSLRYAVRERSKSVYIHGKNPQPRNGKIIGHIIENQFVELLEKPKLACDGPQWLSYGSCALCHDVSVDLVKDLLDVYSPKDAYTIMTIATLRIIHPKVTDSRLNTHYQRTFVSKFFPGVHLCANTVSSFIQRLGEDSKKRESFFQKRLETLCASEHILIDGTLKTDTSTVNDLSAFSRKARIKGCKDLSILYAYDLEKKEPLCAQVFPGNTIDAKAYATFINTNKITKGIIIDDKGFPPSQIYQELKDHPDLHFLTPLKRNNELIEGNHMLDFEGIVSGIYERVRCKKVQLDEHHFLYSFQDSFQAFVEDNTFIDQARKTGKYDAITYKRRAPLFGVIVFESDLDLSCEQIYHCYKDRWNIELVFRHYKNDICLDSTHLQGDFSILGSEFINFIASVISCRIIKKMEDAKLLDNSTYGEIMEDLGQVWRNVNTDLNTKPNVDDGLWQNATTKELKMMEALNLVTTPPKPEKRKPGRPKTIKAEFVGPKRPRGRPRKQKAD